MDNTPEQCPFDLEITILPDGGKETIQCLHLLRQIRGRRSVYEGTWNDTPVILKIFKDLIRKRVHLKREWDGLHQLQQREIPSPKPLFYGQDSAGHFVLVTHQLMDTVNLFEVLDQTPFGETWKAQVRLLLSRIAQMHEKGIYQKDLHAGNFLLRGQEVFALDPAEMIFVKMLTKTMCLDQIAMLLSSLPNLEWDHLPEFAQYYWNQRQWNWGRQDQEYFQTRLKAFQFKNVENALKKATRGGKRFFLLKKLNLFGIFRRDHWDRDQAEGFSQNINSFMDQGQILKDGRTCYVAKIRYDQHDLVIKRYNHKGLWHAFRHTLKGSRARRCWKQGYRLLHLGIDTPLPVGFLEKRRWGLIHQSWIITVFVEGPKLHSFLRDPDTTDSQKEGIKKQVDQLLQKLDKHRITHGDLKHSNLLVTKKGLTLLDLDSVKVHHLRLDYRRKRSKDLSSFREFQD